MRKDALWPWTAHASRALQSWLSGQWPPTHFALQVVVRCEEINISGGIVRQKMKYERFLRKGTRTNPLHGQFHFRAPSQILKRTIRGCGSAPMLSLSVEREATVCA